MKRRSFGRGSLVATFFSFLFWPLSVLAGAPPETLPLVEMALENIKALDRPGEMGLATIFDGNKYVQCRRIADQGLRCESAGALMQPSLAHILTPERVGRLAALGWSLDPSFGNYAQIFPADLASRVIAERILQALGEGYDADLPRITITTDWVVKQNCPPRSGPSQNLAGMINDAPSMAATATHACSYMPPPSPSIRSAADLMEIYGRRVTGEIQRLRVNIERNIFVIMDTQGGYVQCAPQSSPAAIFCEAASADSWPVLANVLTTERVARLRELGFSDPGRTPNFWKVYPLGSIDDAAIGRELLTILYDVYGYKGLPKLAIKTEKRAN
jgi:hypothetical protein